MDVKDEKSTRQETHPGLFDGKSVSRREFLKIAGIAGATVGVSAGLGGLVAACGGGTTTTSAAVATTTTAAPGTTTTVASSTTTLGPPEGREVKIGLVSPQTGVLAAFAKPDSWIVDSVREAVKDGIVCGDGKRHKITILVKDCQSNGNRSAEVTADMILNDKVDMVLASASSEVVNPAADQCEALSTPFLANFVPWEPFYFGRGGTPAKPFKWTYMSHLGLAGAAFARMALWKQIPSNNKLGLLLPNDSDGVALANEQTGLPPYFLKAGYELTFPGLYPTPSEDFTEQISLFKKNGCELCTGIATPADNTNFWKQCLQQGYHPKAMTQGKALIFHEALEALGQIGYGLSADLIWHPAFPFKSSITGQTCQELADQYEQDTGLQWTETIAQYGKFEWAIDVLKRTTDLDNKEEFVAAIQSTNMQTVQGAVDMTAPVKLGTNHPVLNVNVIPICGGQWFQGKKWPFEIVMCSSTDPAVIKPTNTLQPIKYS